MCCTLYVVHCKSTAWNSEPRLNSNDNFIFIRPNVRHMLPNHKIDYFGAVIFQKKTNTNESYHYVAHKVGRNQSFVMIRTIIYIMCTEPKLLSHNSHSEFYEQTSKNYCEAHTSNAISVSLFAIIFEPIKHWIHCYEFDLKLSPSFPPIIET